VFAVFVALEFFILWRQRCARKEGVTLLAIKPRSRALQSGKRSG
jgi:hypothetical protein